MRIAPSTRRRPPGGFTLLELMVTLAVAAVLATIAVPNMGEFLRNSRLAAGSNDLLRSMQLARSEAIKSQRVVAVCATEAPELENATCSNGAFTGWIVFKDENDNWLRDPEEQIFDRQSVHRSLGVVNDHSGVVSYAPSGFANSTPGMTPTSRVVICDVRSAVQAGARSSARALIVEPAGRARIVREPGQIEAALNLIGGTCP